MLGKRKADPLEAVDAKQLKESNPERVMFEDGNKWRLRFDLAVNLKVYASSVATVVEALTQHYALERYGVLTLPPNAKVQPLKGDLQFIVLCLQVKNEADGEACVSALHGISIDEESVNATLMYGTGVKYCIIPEYEGTDDELYRQLEGKIVVRKRTEQGVVFMLNQKDMRRVKVRARHELITFYDYCGRPVLEGRVYGHRKPESGTPL